MVTPTGLPSWTRTASPATYGGVATKRNLGDIGSVNAKTDVSAEEFLRATLDLSHAVRTAPLFWMRLSVVTTPGVVVTVEQFQAQWAPASGTYVGATGYHTGTAPDARYPVLTTASGTLTIAFPGIVTAGSPPMLSIADDFGIIGECKMNAASMSGSDTLFMTHAINADGTEITVGGYETNGAIIHLVVW